jgi:hypothetical protein
VLSWFMGSLPVCGIQGRWPINGAIAYNTKNIIQERYKSDLETQCEPPPPLSRAAPGRGAGLGPLRCVVSTQRIPLAPALFGFSGILPFAGLAAAFAAGASPGLDPLQAFLHYSAIILSFLGGVRWGAAAIDSAAPRAYAFAVAPSLWALGCLSLSSSAAAVWALLAGFVFMGLADWLRPAAPLPPWMRSLRLRLTLAVAVCHLAVILLL